jgi:hypothetical protein
MSEDQERKARSRRDFFRTAGLGAGAAVAGVAGVVGLGEAPAAAAEADAAADGYRETPHVKRYYALAKF